MLPTSQNFYEGDMSKYREYWTPVNPPVHCQFRSFIFWKMLHYCDIVTALTTIHHQSKLQINMQGV